MTKLTLKRIDIKQEHYDDVLPIWGQQTVGQKFFSENDNLSIIKVFTFRSPYGIEGKSKIANAEQIIFHLKEEEKEGNLARVTFSGANVFDGDWLRLQFSPVSDSAGKTYYFYLESPKSTLENAINLAASKTNVYEKGQAVIFGEPKEADLKFQTLYAQSVSKTTQEITADFGLKLAGDKNFTVFWLILILVILVSFLSRLVKRR